MERDNRLSFQMLSREDVTAEASPIRLRLHVYVHKQTVSAKLESNMSTVKSATHTVLALQSTDSFLLQSAFHVP